MKRRPVLKIVATRLGVVQIDIHLIDGLDHQKLETAVWEAVKLIDKAVQEV